MNKSMIKEYKRVTKKLVKKSHTLACCSIKILNFQTAGFLFTVTANSFLEIYIVFEINLNFNLYHTIGLLSIFLSYPWLKSIIHGYKISDSTNVKLSSEIEKATGSSVKI